MADLKITELPAATIPLAGSEKAEIVQGGVNKQVDVSAFAGTSIAPYILDLATPSTAGGTITLDLNSQVQRMFVGSASFGTAKAIALSNTTNALVLNLKLNLTNLAAVITFPSSFTMQGTADTRWNDGAHTFTPTGTGVHEFSATFNPVSTDWDLKVSYPYS